MITNLGCWCSYLCVDIYEFLQQCNKNADRRLMRLNSFVGLVILSFHGTFATHLDRGSGSTSLHYIRPCSSASINKRVATFKSYAAFENKRLRLYYSQCFIFIFLIAICRGCHSLCLTLRVKGNSIGIHLLAHISPHTRKKAALPHSCPKVKA